MEKKVQHPSPGWVIMGKQVLLNVCTTKLFKLFYYVTIASDSTVFTLYFETL